MSSWNPFGKVDMEIGSFLNESVFNKEYENNNAKNNKNSSKGKELDNKAIDDK